MDRHELSSGRLASDITRAASNQTYYTIRIFVDRQRKIDAYRAYGYFRWVDDIIDANTGTTAEKIAFAERQKALIDACYRGEVPQDLCAEEWMLADLVREDREPNSGLQIYLRDMMDVMLFDVRRRGQIISQAELFRYSHQLAEAVASAMCHFIGHDTPPPCLEPLYLAVTAAHITHMLRDAVEDVENGYFNVPGEYLQARGLSPQDLTSQAHRAWVCGRVRLAREYFQMSQKGTAQVRSLRCRLAGYAYTARFQWMLKAIERDNFCLRAEYPERRSLQAGLWMLWSAVTSMFSSLLGRAESRKLAQ